MSKFIEFLKNLRAEYKVAIFILMILIFYSIYALLLKDYINLDFLKSRVSSSRTSQSSSHSGGSYSGKSSESGKPHSINEAVSSPKPIILSSPKAVQGRLNSLSNEDDRIKSMELATEVENPIIWIYITSDGERKDNLAKKYCKWLHENGVPASSVTILDEAGRHKGRLIELGESKCM